MKPPIRMVCGDCLRSVEVQVDGTGLLPTFSTCPHCGGTIDSRLSEQGTWTDDRPDPLLGGALPEGPKLWSETWVKGSLGTLGRFQLRELLGDGGFGQVFQAYDPRLDRDIALKVLKQAEPGERVMQRFFREARAAARLAHPNIVAVHDAGSDDGRCWIAYQFVSGRTLFRQRESQRLALADAVRIIRDLADALDHAHRQGIYHRDLKPANIIIDDRGRPHLTDFGLARRADLDSDLTRDGAILGTPMYMSPEQASGHSHLADERSDVYSLGVIFYELLCGQRPTNLPSQAPLWPPRPAEPPPAPRSIDRSIPPTLERICLKALAADPNQRYSDARTLRDELDLWLRRRQDPMRLSVPLACIVTGVAALLLVVALKALLTPAAIDHPPAIVAAAPPASQAPTPAPAPAPVGPTAQPPAPSTVAPETEARTKDEEPALAVHHQNLVGNNKSHKYHLPTCSSAREIHDANRVEFEDVDQAFEQGFRPCDKCHPPQSKLNRSSTTTDLTPD